VDPARCRIWRYHNRDYAALSEETCADLLESIKAQGRQEVPAIVRRVSDAPDHDWEVICGARRHWTISWLRAHSYPEIKFLVEPRELTDEEAFRLADLENRSRRDLSDYERATDYARAIDLFYDGSQQRMAERLEVTKSWLSRYLELAKLPATILAAFGTPHALGISHAATLAPLLKSPKSADALMEAAEALATEQRARHLDGSPFLAPAACVQRLTARGQGRGQPVREQAPITIKSAGGDVLLKAQIATRGGALTIIVPAAAKLEPSALEAGFS
jgi:ParB family chromosome partitioning protein